MSIEPCELHEIINCGVCKPKPKPETPIVSSGSGKFRGPAAPTNPDRFIEAKFDGWCLYGEHPIEAGDMITRSPDDQGWNCEEHA